VAAGDERFGGLVWYTLAYAAFTWLGFATAMFPAAAALVALSFGDGVGGLVGRRFGRHRYAVPWGKQKSLEGSMFVALTSSAGAALVAFWFDAHVPPSVLFGIGAVAAVAEALSPRGTDNILVPSAVWLAAELLT
jgi:dolichol kinase